MDKIKINKTTVTISLTILSIVVILLAVFPNDGLEVIENVFNFTTNTFGVSLLWFSLFCTIVCVYLFFSKYGNIKLGEGKPKYSLFSYIAMIICSGLASASIYFSFVEWAFYYTSPALGIDAESTQAVEYAMAYEFFHWGLASWPPFAVAALPIAYSFYVRKYKGLRFSSVLENMMTSKLKYPLGKLVDILFIITVLGALGVTLGLGVPIISTLISKITGISDGFGLNVGVVVFIALLFSLSSFVGVDKGMKRISDWNINFAILFILFILITGPTLFLLKSMTNSLGIHLQNYLSMVLWTDPIGNSGFPEAWTMFFICFAISYAPLMALFITKISQGRKIKEVVGSVVLGGSVGSYIIFGVNSGFAIHSQLLGKLNIPEILELPNGDSLAIVAILEQTILPNILAYIAIAVILTLFLATSLDSAAHSLTLTSMIGEEKNEGATSGLRLFWCVILSLLPLCMMFIGAPLSAIQTLAVVTGFPFALVMIFFIFGLFKWLKEDEKLLNK